MLVFETRNGAALSQPYVDIKPQDGVLLSSTLKSRDLRLQSILWLGGLPRLLRPGRLLILRHLFALSDGGFGDGLLQFGCGPR